MARQTGLRRTTLGLAILCLLLGACALLAPPGDPATREDEARSWFESEGLHALLDSETRSERTAGNEVDLLVNGTEAFVRRYENLSTARFALVKTFIFTDDETGRRMARALSARAREGIPVVLQYDLKGSIGGSGDIAEMLARASPLHPLGEKRIIRDMREAGVHVIATNSPARPLELMEWWRNLWRLARSPVGGVDRSIESLLLLDHCDHEKYFITGHDGGEVRAILGGMNVASEYALGGVSGRKDPVTGRGGWRDTDVEVRGPAARHTLNDFAMDAERQTGRPLPERVLKTIREAVGSPDGIAGRARVRLVANHPLDESTRHTEEVYRILLEATPPGEPVFLATPYFAPSARLRSAIVAHAGAGGVVTVLTNSPESNDIGLLADAARYTSQQILRRTENFRLFEWKPRTEEGEHTLHEKVASFGTRGPVIVGSFNLDAQSAIHNTESLLVIEDADLRREFDEMVERDLAPDSARELAREDLETEAVLERVRIFLGNRLAWYWL